jgi:predicted nuclease of restriction endonuclease-like (RecB) superfamily
LEFGYGARYGEHVVAAIATRLEVEFGRGFGEKNLRRMVQFAEQFPDEQIVAALLRQLGWTHFTLLLPIKDSLRREFYAEMCRMERWNTRTLQKKIQSMLFERTALSRQPEQLAQVEIKALRERDKLTPDLVFRDPYFLDFLGLKDVYAERDLEMAILREMESFILELGAGFAFLERQKRMTVDGIDYYLDLLFFHRDLRRLVAIELKIGEFHPGDKGQMELYLRWLCYGTFCPPSSTACGKRPPCPRSSPARRVDSVLPLRTQDLAATLPVHEERARLVGA